MSTLQNSTNSRPALHGAKIKQRKGIQKAQAKFEPEVFRDNFFKILSTVRPGNFDEISSKLDAAGNTLDYRKYGDCLFEILITGGILEPGGSIDENSKQSAFSIFSAQDNQASIKKHVEVFNKLIRRYKYLQKAFEETLKNVLQYINKWTPQQNNKLAMTTGYFIVSQMANMTILVVLLKEHLVKEGFSLQFVTAVFKAYLSEQTIDYLGNALNKISMDSKLLEFFPPNKRDEECFARHFEAEDMKLLVEYHQKNQRNTVKEKFLEKLKEMTAEDKSPQEVIVYTKQQMKENNYTEQEIALILWESVMAAVDLTTRPDQVESQTIRQVNQWSKVMAAFTASPKTEIILMQKVQTTCYEDAKLMKHFRQIIHLLYKHDVLSENAILYWAEKGARPQGKTIFMKQMEPFIKWLKENESEEDEDEE